MVDVLEFLFEDVFYFGDFFEGDGGVDELVFSDVVVDDVFYEAVDVVVGIGFETA